MARIIRLNDGGVQYNHLIAQPNENERNYIFGGDGDDIIVGDNETWGDYGPDWGSPDQGRQYDNLAEYEEIGSSMWLISAAPGDDTSSDAIMGIHPNGSKKYQEIDEYISGNAGNDFLIGGGGNDWLHGGLDNDTIAGGIGNDLLDGGTGNDLLIAGDGVGDFDIIFGGKGDDTVSFAHATRGSFADGGDDTDTLKLVSAYNTFAFDLVTGSDGLSTGLRFNAINFELLEYTGKNGIDAVWGGALEDTLRGNGGDDYFDGRQGADKIYGGNGHDTVIGGDGDDELFGGNDADTISDGEGNDTVYGDGGDDIINTGEGNDTVHGGAGNDKITEEGADKPYHRQGRSPNDTLYGDDGDDEIDGGEGVDFIFGGEDNDTIAGGAGNDKLSGGDDDDTISGGSGIDELTGGEGKDTFVFQFGDFEIVNGNPLMGIDRIKDFQPDLDKVDLRDFAAHATGGKLYLDDNDGTPGEAGEVMFTPRGSNNEHTMLSLDLEGDGKYDVRVLFDGLAFDPDNFSTQNVLLVV